MGDPVLGQISMFAGNFAPRGWALCDGQLLPISQYTALFSILGTTYGGDGRTTFGLPDLRSRAPMHAGHGPGLSNVKLGAKGGNEFVTLNATQMPNHAHSGVGLTGTATMPCTDDDGSTNEPAGNVLANAASGTPYASVAANETLASTGTVAITGNTATTGGNRPFDNKVPFQAVNFVIALIGIFPSRS